MSSRFSIYVGWGLWAGVAAVVAVWLTRDLPFGIALAFVAAFVLVWNWLVRQR